MIRSFRRLGRTRRITALFVAVLLCAPAFSFALSINEIRVDQTGADTDEYFELFGAPGESLAGLSYLVIGDGSGGSGVVEAAVSLDGYLLRSDGLFLVAESSFTLGAADLVTGLNFENSDNVTHMLVSDFSGGNGNDLDTNDDGLFDLTPWSAIMDAVGLVETPASGERVYTATTIGPDGTSAPYHVYRELDGIGPWRLGDQALGAATETAGFRNGPDMPGPPEDPGDDPAAPVPEPGTLTLLAAGLSTLAAGSRRRKKSDLSTTPASAR